MSVIGECSGVKKTYGKSSTGKFGVNWIIHPKDSMNFLMRPPHTDGLAKVSDCIVCV